MKPDTKADSVLRDAADGRPITKAEAALLLGLPEASLEFSSARNGYGREPSAIRKQRLVARPKRVDMSPCDGDCDFCFFAKSHTSIQSYPPNGRDR